MQNRVFISYAQEGDLRRKQVSDLATQLRSNGVEISIDQDVELNPPYWPNWMIEQVVASDFVLCVVSEEYQRRFESPGGVSPGRGVNWEGLFLTELSYTDVESAHRKFIAVSFSEEDRSHVPRILLGTGRTSYLLPDDFDSLLRRLKSWSPDANGTHGHSNFESPDARRRPGQVVVLARPETKSAKFFDRREPLEQLGCAFRDQDRGMVVVSGRPGSGKSALIGEAIDRLEAEGISDTVEVSYLSLGSEIQPSADLLRSALSGPCANRSASRPPDLTAVETDAKARRIVVLDAADRCFDGQGQWCDGSVGEFLNRLVTDDAVLLVLLVERLPAPSVLGGRRTRHVPISPGLPEQDASQLLRSLDSTGRLGLQDDDAAIHALVQVSGGNPRVLELASAILAEDPTRDPHALAELAGEPGSPLAEALAQVYSNLNEREREVVGLLASIDLPMPYEILACAVENQGTLRETIAGLVSKQLARFDRQTQQLRLEYIDSQYVANLLCPENVSKAPRVRVAQGAALVVKRGKLPRPQATLWALAAIELLWDSDLQEESAALLDDMESLILEPEGVYDELIRLRRRALESGVVTPVSQSSLLRVLTLSGALDAAELFRKEIEDSDAGYGAARDQAEWRVETGSLARDLGKSQRALRDFREALDVARSAAVAVQSLAATAQLLRRLNRHRVSEACLQRAVHLTVDADPSSFQEIRQSALVQHQLAMTRRMGGRTTEARAHLVKSEMLSQSVEDRGGLAYRACLRAALDSDRFALSSAVKCLEFSASVYDDIGDTWGRAASAYATACIEADLGRYDRAFAALEAASLYAARSGNLRVRGLLAGARLVIERRAGKLSESTVHEVAAARDFLEARGLRFYARRLELGLELHWLCTMPTKRSTGAPRSYSRARISNGPEDALSRAKQLIRPHGELMWIGASIPPGIATDLEAALTAWEGRSRSQQTTGYGT